MGKTKVLVHCVLGERGRQVTGDFGEEPEKASSTLRANKGKNFEN